MFANTCARIVKRQAGRMRAVLDMTGSEHVLNPDQPRPQVGDDAGYLISKEVLVFILSDIRYVLLAMPFLNIRQTTDLHRKMAMFSANPCKHFRKRITQARSKREVQFSLLFFLVVWFGGFYMRGTFFPLFALHPVGRSSRWWWMIPTGFEPLHRQLSLLGPFQPQPHRKAWLTTTDVVDRCATALFLEHEDYRNICSLQLPA